MIGSFEAIDGLFVPLSFYVVTGNPFACRYIGSQQQVKSLVQTLNRFLTFLSSYVSFRVTGTKLSNREVGSTQKLKALIKPLSKIWQLWLKFLAKINQFCC